MRARATSGYFIEHLLDRPDVRGAWKQFVHHPFVMAIGNGTLPLASFKGYIIQDYLYLASPPSHLHPLAAALPNARHPPPSRAD